MSLSLRDQLLQAGLINEKQAKQAAHAKRQERKQQPRGAPSPQAEEQRRAAAAAQAAKAERDAELNRQRREKVEAKERRLQVKALIEQHRLPKVDGFDYYSFVDGKKVRRIAVTAALRKQLADGRIAIVKCDGRYDLVPLAAAERIRERDPRAVVPPPAPEPTVIDENDPYKDFVVPDDLMW
jgi:uncharacterized protein YaiL (DUF2058 family)